MLYDELNRIDLPVTGNLPSEEEKPRARRTEISRKHHREPDPLLRHLPVRVNDFGHCGDTLGTVEHTGLFSTRIRTLERSVLGIPNADCSRLQPGSLARRDRMLFKTLLHLRFETTTEQLQQVLSRIRALLLGHEKVHEDPARVRLLTVGPYEPHSDRE